jgi:YfiH family protein
MILRNRNGIDYYQFKLLDEIPGLWHAVFTRNRGASIGPYASLNAGLSVGDSPERVAHNRELIRTCLGHSHLQFIEQVHGDAVVVIEAGRPNDVSPPPTGDALVTGIAGLTLVTQVADCQPVFICDPECRVIANIHSGWRGSAQNIIGRTIAVMVDQYGCKPESLLAGIGPSLGPCCAEFVNFRAEIPPGLWQYKDKRDHFDFWAISRDQLRHAGLVEPHIEVGGLCTRCRTDLFYSYRAEGITGRLAAAIGLAGDKGQRDQ